MTKQYFPAKTPDSGLRYIDILKRIKVQWWPFTFSWLGWSWWWERLASVLPFTFIDNFLCRILILCISRPALRRWNPLRRLQKYLEIMPDLSDFLRDLTIKHSVYQLVCLSYSCSINCKKISGLYSVNCYNISGNVCENLPIPACCDSFILWYPAYQVMVLKHNICL